MRGALDFISAYSLFQVSDRLLIREDVAFLKTNCQPFVRGLFGSVVWRFRFWIRVGG
jgi:hypothetical protein